MKILMLSPYAPYPPNSGGRIRQWEQIKYLGRHHDLTVVYYAFTEEEYEMQKSIRGFCTQALAVKHPNRFQPSDFADLMKLPWPVRMFRTTEMLKTLEELRSADFDAGIVEFIFMSQYHDLVPACAILHEHNIESNIFKQYAELPNIAEEEIYGMRKNRSFWKATWILMADYENKMWSKFPLRATVSAKDKHEMDGRCTDGRTVVIENGVNTNSFAPATNNNSRKILFMGTLNYHPNTDAVSYLEKSIMPYIWRKDPTIMLCIAGLNPPLSIREIATDPRVELIENPEDMREVAAACCLSLVPLRFGGGTRIKILDSMAMGLPVVSTSIGCEGLLVTDGGDILVRDDPEKFADAVLKIISDPVLADNLRKNGRRLVEERYGWSRMFKQLEAEIFSLIDLKKSALVYKGAHRNE